MADATTASPRTYRLLLGAVVVFPALLAGVLAWWNWDRVRHDVVVGLVQRVDMLHENALRLMQTDELILARLDDQVAGLSWPDIVARKSQIAAETAATIANVDDLEGAGLVDPEGTLEIVARRDTPPTTAETVLSNLNVRDRLYFQAAAKGPDVVIDGPFKSRLNGEPFIYFSRRLSSPDGSFRGVAALTFSPKHLAEFWSMFITPGDSISLIRDDGTVLVRVTDPPVDDEGQRVSDLAIRNLRSADRGEFEQRDSVFDGTSRHLAFRKIGAYPIYVVYGIDRQNVLREWYPTVTAFGGLAAIAAIALFLVALAVVRRAVDLRDSEARYRALYDYTPVPMHALDINGNIVAVSDRWLDLMGFSRSEVIGRPIINFHKPESATAFSKTGWQQAIEAGGARDLERQYVRKSGEVLDVLISARVERDAADRFLRMAVVVIDVTEQKRVEGTLRQVQKMEAVGQLTGGIAHDFNNLLTVIGGNIDMIRLRLQASAAPELRRLVEAAQRGAVRAATLTQRLLAFSRRQPLDPKPLNPNRLVSGMSDLLSRTLGEGVGVETVLAAGLWWVAADPNQLENALLNLAVNARDAMPGGGKLTIETANTFLDESYSSANQEVTPGQYVMIAVSDTGTGMSEQTIAKAFEPFFTTKRVGQGTGLGLSQVYGFIKQSGGHVKIYSEPDQGTTVKLYLPRLTTDEMPETPAEPRQVPASGTPGATILVVEDDEDVRAFAADILNDLGYRVLLASDAAAGLRVLEQEPYIHLLFTDVGLPGQYNGREFADEARRRWPGLKVLFTTGYARNAIVHHGRLDAGVELILKPYTHADLAAKIRDVLESDGPPAKARPPAPDA